MLGRSCQNVNRDWVPGKNSVNAKKEYEVKHWIVKEFDLVERLYSKIIQLKVIRKLDRSKFMQNSIQHCDASIIMSLLFLLLAWCEHNAALA